MSAVRVFSPPPLPPVDRREVWRYAGIRNRFEGEPQLPQQGEAATALLEDCLAEVLPTLRCRLAHVEYPLLIEGDRLDLGFAAVQSAALARCMAGCSRFVLFGATIGQGLDRLLLKHGRRAPASALLCQAIGAERIEALCDAFTDWLEAEVSPRGLFLRPRFSPGYGDLPLTLQREILRALDSPRTLGITLNRSLLMSPSKSVTAIIGLGPLQGSPPQR